MAAVPLVCRPDRSVMFEMQLKFNLLLLVLTMVTWSTKSTAADNFPKNILHLHVCVCSCVCHRSLSLAKNTPIRWQCECVCVCVCPTGASLTIFLFGQASKTWKIHNYIFWFRVHSFLFHENVWPCVGNGENMSETMARTAHLQLDSWCNTRGAYILVRGNNWPKATAQAE